MAGEDKFEIWGIGEKKASNGEKREKDEKIWKKNGELEKSFRWKWAMKSKAMKKNRMTMRQTRIINNSLAMTVMVQITSTQGWSKYSWKEAETIMKPKKKTNYWYKSAQIDDSKRIVNARLNFKKAVQFICENWQKNG